jgi:hypothetical protein
MVFRGFTFSLVWQFFLANASLSDCVIKTSMLTVHPERPSVSRYTFSSVLEDLQFLDEYNPCRDEKSKHWLTEFDKFSQKF